MLLTGRFYGALVLSDRCFFTNSVPLCDLLLALYIYEM